MLFKRPAKFWPLLERRYFLAFSYDKRDIMGLVIVQQKLLKTLGSAI